MMESQHISQRKIKPTSPTIQDVPFYDEENDPFVKFDTTSKDRKDDVPQANADASDDTQTPISMSKSAYYVLALLACQNCFKNILMRFVMKDEPRFLVSTAVITIELLKLTFSATYIVTKQRQPLSSIFWFIKEDWENTVLLCVPAICYNIQSSLEYVAFANIDAASFAVLVQTKMLATALFFKLVLGKKMMKKQLLSLIILTVGVMMCNMKSGSDDANENDGTHGYRAKGIAATLGIALSSGFASVYTEKVIKSSRKKSISDNKEEYGLPHMQCQLAMVSICTLGCYAITRDAETILTEGFFCNFNGPAFLSCLNSAIGGLIVAAVLKYADSVLKGYATAVSVVLTGVFSSYIFHTSLSTLFGMGIINVVISVVLYNCNDLDDYIW
mmetsp:Transcript_15874/g.18088  ORF Transcript_15874/g.18088 Transcript_15874/m.18088 type:complete len:387 (+) Transcript_15874:178-1338(+)